MINFAKIIEKSDLTNLPQTVLSGGSGGTVSKALQLVFGVMGAVSLLVITIGALKYIVSMGDPQSTAKAKNTIIYAVIGLVISASAFSIVAFVVGKL